MLPKSDAAGRAYSAAMADVLEHGSLPVPKHLRAATGRQKRDTGDGSGYRNPHDFEGDDLAQQYLPDKLHELGRRYYFPSDQGQEAGLAARMAARLEARQERARRKAARTGPPAMSGMSDGMKAYTEGRKRRAEAQRQEERD